MPQPYRHRPGTGLMGGGHAMRTRPLASAGIGYVAASWTNLEDQMVRLFEAIMGHKVERQGEGFNYTHFPAAAATLEALESLSARLSVMRAVVEERATPQIVELFDEMAKETRRVAGARNAVVHGHWSVSDMHPEALVLLRKGVWTVYEPRDFDDISRRIDLAALGFGKVWDGVLAHYADSQI